MKYLYLKNLKNQHVKDSIKKSKIQQLFIQKIDAFQYFHSQEIVHQNIKSKNILVKHQEVFFHIKLTDFELFKNIFFLKIIYESLIYLALKIQKKCYDNKIDI